MTDVRLGQKMNVSFDEVTTLRVGSLVILSQRSLLR